MANSLLGNLEEACDIFDRVIRLCDPELHRVDMARIQNEVLSWALTWRARTMWMRGFADHAQADAEAGLREAVSGDHYLSITLALVLGVCPIAMAVGDLETLERYATSNFGQDGRARITASVSIWARAFRGAVLVERGETAEGILLLRRALDTAPFGTLTGIHQPMLCKLAKALSTAGDAGQALALLEPIIEKPQSGWDALFLPELLCASGEIRLSLNQLDVAEQLYQRALELSGRKKQLAWQLRAATGLARCWIIRGRRNDGRALLSDVMSKFTEGFATLDWIAAESVARQLSSS
jgi:tetratricopeptide (TPR) repeat protein